MCSLAVGSFAFVTGSAGSPAQAASTFDGTAAGDLVRHTVHASPLIIEDLAEVGSITAQARVTASGESMAFGATPYPGAQGMTVPGLVIGALGLPMAAPDYPLTAASSYPTKPSAEVHAGSVDLRAASDELTSQATATDGGSFAKASVVADSDGVVTAHAQTETKAADFGPTFSVGGVRSESRVVRVPDGDVDRETSFSVASMTVLGQRLHYADGRFEIASQALPPNQAAEEANKLLAGLQEHGLTVRVLAPEETEDGVYSAGLEVKRVTEVNGTVVTLTSTFGRSYAAVMNRGLTDPDQPDPSLPPITDGGGGGDVGGEGAGELPASGMETAAPTPTATAAPGGAAPLGRPSLAATSTMRPETAPAGRFYPILILAGACLVAILDVFRKWGVRLTWMS